MSTDRVHRVIDVEPLENPPEELLKGRSYGTDDEGCPGLDIVAARGDTDIPHDEPIDPSEQVEDLSLRLPEADEAIDDTRD